MGGDKILRIEGRSSHASDPTFRQPICRGGREGNTEEPTYPMPLQGIFCIIALNSLRAMKLSFESETKYYKARIF